MTIVSLLMYTSVRSAEPEADSYYGGYYGGYGLGYRSGYGLGYTGGYGGYVSPYSYGLRYSGLYGAHNLGYYGKRFVKAKACNEKSHSYIKYLKINKYFLQIC